MTGASDLGRAKAASESEKAQATPGRAVIETCASALRSGFYSTTPEAVVTTLCIRAAGIHDGGGQGRRFVL